MPDISRISIHHPQFRKRDVKALHPSAEICVEVLSLDLENAPRKTPQPYFALIAFSLAPRSHRLTQSRHANETQLANSPQTLYDDKSGGF